MACCGKSLCLRKLPLPCDRHSLLFPLVCGFLPPTPPPPLQPTNTPPHTPILDFISVLFCFVTRTLFVQATSSLSSVSFMWCPLRMQHGNCLPPSTSVHISLIHKPSYIHARPHTCTHARVHTTRACTDIILPILWLARCHALFLSPSHTPLSSCFPCSDRRPSVNE